MDASFDFRKEVCGGCAYITVSCVSHELDPHPVLSLLISILGLSMMLKRSRRELFDRTSVFLVGKSGKIRCERCDHEDECYVSRDNPAAANFVQFIKI
ncbi:hypothetical protein Y032_0016g2936 [Ancylostoma ceylanicum]|uniref:Uncharacterized protein n=1 Tax=Ancylostoma ceylanicum TaxID=53326 RepID=A0A016V6X8_9BILA|nr:hypothetical protein Y032_0016g2936 [Ancylostoma ceylanicum]